MLLRAVVGVLTVVFAVAAPSPAVGGSDDDPAQGTVWDLSPLYRDDAAWERDRLDLETSLPELAQLKEGFGASAESLRTGLDKISGARQRLNRLDEYASLKAAVDASLDANQARVQAMSRLHEQFGEATSFISTQVIALGPERIEAFEKADAGLSPHRRQLELILRRSAHTLGPEAERIVLATDPLRQQPGAIHDILLYSDIPWPTLEIDGKAVELEPEAYRATLFNPDRRIRRKAFESVVPILARYERTAGAVAFAFLEGTAFEARARHYPSSLALALGDDAMPEANFGTLVAAADRAAPTLHRYLELRRKILGLDELHVYDLRVPVGRNPHRYRLDEAEALILKALRPLGEDYVHRLDKGFHSQAMHAIAQPGKAPGASTYSDAYRVQPFVSVTFDGTYDSVSAVAHEWGHAMHGQFFQAAQPFENADITSTFIFDAPSLTNEILLGDYMIAHAQTRQDKILALDQAIDLLRSSYFGALMDVEFEIKAHEIADRGDTLTGRVLNEIYCGLLKHFDGVEEGVTAFDESACSGWVIRPGIYYDFYFYKYLTAVSAAAFLVDGLEKGDADTRKRFFDLLKAGGSDDPDVLLKRAGFDASSPSAYQPMVRRLERLVAQLEAETKG
jgi:oligoendopeptidase F